MICPYCGEYMEPVRNENGNITGWEKCCPSDTGEKRRGSFMWWWE